MDKVRHAETLGLSGRRAWTSMSDKLVDWKGTGSSSKLTGGIGILFKQTTAIEWHVAGTGQGHRTRARSRSPALDGKKQTLSCDDIVIATGSVPSSRAGVRLRRRARLVLDRSALAPEERSPSTLLVIGGGYIGLELGLPLPQAWQRSHGRSSSPMARCPARIATASRSSSARSRSPKHQARSPRRRPRATTKKGDELRGHGRGSEGRPTRPSTCDQILCTVGRKPYSEGLGLESVGLKPDEARASSRLMQADAAPRLRASGPSVTSPASRCWRTRAARKGIVAAHASSPGENEGVRRALRSGGDLHRARDGVGRNAARSRRPRRSGHEVADRPVPLRRVRPRHER